MEKRKKYISLESASQRMFKSHFIEFFSKVHFTIPILIYSFIIGYLVYLSKPMLISWLLFLSGLFFWTWSEYILHRFMFHYEASSRIGQRFFYIFHGYHHDFPNDRKRLVMPPVVSLLLSTIFCFCFWTLLGLDYAIPFSAGFLLGYISYDSIHYALHHLKWKNKYWRILQSHHMAHHYKEETKGYGVSSPFWDYIFRTVKKNKN